MENLLVRAAKHEEAVSVIRNNNEKLRAERDARTHKTEVFARDRALEQAVLPRYTRVLIVSVPLSTVAVPAILAVL